jgi:hypothetical protein
MRKVPCAAKHIKTGNIYRIITTAIDATNGPEEGRLVVVYERNDKTFVRDLREFIIKFEVLE